jgi:Mg2+ and Co2+ transporter CorA
MQMHSSNKEDSSENVPPPFAPGEMLRRTGECRKKVMGLYRLLSNKADVVKGFAKRCNEQWEVAPKSEIGLYLGDIQDHIMTMTGNLTHYETWVFAFSPLYLGIVFIGLSFTDIFFHKEFCPVRTPITWRRSIS